MKTWRRRKSLIGVVLTLVVVAVVVWLLQGFGLVGSLQNIRMR